MRKLKMTIGSVEITAELFETPTADAIFKNLPFSMMCCESCQPYPYIPIHIEKGVLKAFPFTFASFPFICPKYGLRECCFDVF